MAALRASIPEQDSDSEEAEKGFLGSEGFRV